MDQSIRAKKPSGTVNYSFVDTIRCISMIGIVFLHCSVFWGIKYKSFSETLIETAVMQILKFSTIAFFLIGGFLINHKFNEYSAGQYLKNRFKNTVRPWLFWVIVFFVLDVIGQLTVYFRYGSNDAFDNLPTYLLGETGHILFYTSYWFIPNFLICIALLLIFKKYLYNVWFGVFLGALSVFYSVNLYGTWVPTEHSTALFGFVFYLWLGVVMNKHFDKVMAFINKTAWNKLILINIIFFVLSVAEGIYLNRLGSGDSFDTLKFTNILYSLSMFAALLKIGGINIIQSKLNPRQTTFGIYLVHQVLIVNVLPLIFTPLKIKNTTFDASGNIIFTLVRFVIVYVLSFFLTVGIGKTRIKWVVGQ